MWGNALGWSISALIVIGTVSVLVWMEQAAKVTTPRTEFSQNTSHGAAIVMPADPKLVVPEMIDPADAGEFYRTALEMVLKDPAAYERYARGDRQIDIEEMLGCHGDCRLKGQARVSASLFSVAQAASSLVPARSISVSPTMSGGSPFSITKPRTMRFPVMAPMLPPAAT